MVNIKINRYLKFTEVKNSNTSKCIILYPITLTILSSSFEIRPAQFQQQLLIPDVVKKFLSSVKRPGRFCGLTSFPFNGQRELFSRWQTSRSVKLTVHLHPVPRLRLSGATSLHLTWIHSLHSNNFALRRTSNEENELIFTPYVTRILKLQFVIEEAKFLCLNQISAHRTGNYVTFSAAAFVQSKLPLERCF